MMLSGAVKLVMVVGLFSEVFGESGNPCRPCQDWEIQVATPDRPPCCSRGVRERCGRAAHCNRGLTCRYPYRGAAVGYCKVPTGKLCMVNDSVYHHGERFLLDCRTLCVCKNGTYACASRCPRESIVPRDACNGPRLIDVPGRCCREWMCNPPEQEPHCEAKSTTWSDCSSDCGGGVAHRSSNSNSQCLLKNGTRFCQTESCNGLGFYLHRDAPHHRFRRGHACKATVRARPSRLRVGPCASRRVYRPRLCGGCVREDKCCKPLRSVTIKVEMRCGSLMIDEEYADIHKILMEYMVSGQDIWESSDTTKKHKRHSEHHSLKKDLKRFMFNETTYYDLTTGLPLKRFRKNTHFVNMEWVIKCACKEKFCKKKDRDYDFMSDIDFGNVPRGHDIDTTADRSEELLHRVHRTA